MSGGVVSHVGVALTFGLMVMTMIYALGEVSGAHINPAVTLGFWIGRRLSGRDVLPYLLSQCAGAVAASLVLRLLWSIPTWGLLYQLVRLFNPCMLEVIMTFFLMFVILSVSTGAKEKGIMAGAAIGAVVGLEALFAGPISGASMNPARSLAPALVTGRVDNLWVYLLAPVVGACLGVAVCHCVHRSGCCAAQQVEE